MRYSFLLLFAVTLSSYRVAAECCGTNGADSCCSAGNGNCNIFCCNCEDGCANTDTCSDKCLNLCLKGCSPIPADPKEWEWLGQQCYIECGKQCKPTEATEAFNEPVGMSLARNVFKRGIVMSDEAIFREVDGRGKGYFSYDQFLQKQGWRDNEGARAHFDRHDMDGDGMIKIGEMRIDGYLD